MQPNVTVDKSAKINFSTFKASFSTNVNYLKRRFSSGDLSSEIEEENAGQGPSTSPNQQKSPQPQQPPSTVGGERQPPQDLSIKNPTPAPPAATMNSKTISAPTSPAKSGGAGGFLQRVQSLTGVAKEMTSNLTSQVIATAGGNLGAPTVVVNKMPVRLENCLYLLVIDDQNTDWSKYFKTRKVNELEINVEQCEFNEVSVVSGSDFGCVVSYPTWKDGAKLTRQFQPDFILIRQNLKDAGRDYKNLLLALMYGGVPSVNSLQAVYNFQDKPWVFAHMMNIQRKHHNFPLIEQYFYPDFKEMASIVPKLPGVLKIGHAHGGLGKIRANNINDYQDASSVVAVTGTYCTSEPYVEARCDVHIQKIGNQYKAFMRKGIVGHWKSGSGSAMLEQVAMNERYKQWVDNVALLFGGLDICALEVIVGKDGREYIIEVNDSALTLMGESQEEDRRHIAELVLSRMQLLCKIPQAPQQQMQQTSQPPQPQQQSSSPQQRYRRQSGSGSDVVNEDSSNVTARRDSQSSTSSRGSSFFARQNSQSGASGGGGPSPNPPGGAQQAPAAGGPVEDSEDTMKNLRKTFAGIFGDM